MKIVKKIIRRKNDFFFKKLNRYRGSWGSLNGDEFKNMANSMGFEIGMKMIDGKLSPYLYYDGLYFQGPVKGEDFNCAKVIIDEGREALIGVIENKLEDEEIALMRNVLLRYKNEFCKFPVENIRTSGLQKGSNFVDIGSFRGYLSLKASKLVSEKDIVFAFEPMKNNFEIIEKQISKNNIRNVKVYNAAVSTEVENSISFYSSSAQKNSQVKDHIDKFEIKEISVDNYDVSKLWDEVTQNRPNRLVFSIKKILILN